MAGMENLPVSAYLNPPLTSVDAALREIGRAAVRRVLGVSPPTEGPELLPGRVVVRESCGSPESALANKERG